MDDNSATRVERTQELLRRMLVAIGLSGMDAPTEADSERDGFLSYAGEVHAFVSAGGAGIAAALLGRPELVGLTIAVALGVKGADRFNGRFVSHEIRREPWYAIGAAVISYVLASGPVQPLLDALTSLA